MKKFLLSLCLLPTLFLSACTPDVSEIQRITQQICGFVPTAVQVASWFPIPYTAPAGAIATAICQAVTTQVTHSARLKSRQLRGQAPVSATVNVNGQQFVVTGYFVR